MMKSIETTNIAMIQYLFIYLFIQIHASDRM